MLIDFTLKYTLILKICDTVLSLILFVKKFNNILSGFSTAICAWSVPIQVLLSLESIMRLSEYKYPTQNWYIPWHKQAQSMANGNFTIQIRTLSFDVYLYHSWKDCVFKQLHFNKKTTIISWEFYYLISFLLYSR